MENPAQQSAHSGSNLHFQEIVRPLQPAFAALEDYLEAQVESFEPEVRSLVRFCLEHSGKKLRPILVFSMADAMGDEPADPVIRAAAIVELVHLATLVHDDILDEADLRHRTETVVAKYGPHVAVLLGDALFAHSLHLAAQFPGVEVCRAVSLATRQVCSGEIAQTFARGEGVPSREEYLKMIDLKTAELFAVSAYLGGFLAGFNSSSLKAAREYARHLGIAYQIYDDAADIFGEEGRAGKTLGTDLATGKLTLPVILWLERLSEEKREEVLENLRTGNNGRKAVQQLLLDDGILGRVREVFFQHIEKATKAIEFVPSENRRRQLLKLAEFVELAWNKFSIR